MNTRQLNVFSILSPLCKKVEIARTIVVLVASESEREKLGKLREKSRFYASQLHSLLTNLKNISGL